MRGLSGEWRACEGPVLGARRAGSDEQSYGPAFDGARAQAAAARTVPAFGAATRSGETACFIAQFQSSPPCVSGTALGVDVEPEVKSTTASCSARTSAAALGGSPSAASALSSASLSTSPSSPGSILCSHDAKARSGRVATAT